MSGRLLVAAVLSLGVLTACSTPARTAVRYAKPGVESPTRQQDEIACLRVASQVNDEGYLLLPFQIDRAAFERCMQDRGYMATAGGEAPVTREEKRP